MNRKILSALSLTAAIALAAHAHADVTNFTLSGSGITAQGTITYTANPGGIDDITNITGTFSDSNPGLNITNVGISNIVPIDPVNPLPAAVTAPDFSQFTVTNGVPSTPRSSSLSYDNNFYPAGSPSVCTDYPFFGGTLDVYGLMFNLPNNDVVCVWSNGNNPNVAGPIYGVAVADGTNTYDYVNGGVDFVVPEPSTLALTALALIPLARRRRKQD
ncbi:MAG TPA: PEP-CTERM sorting domain-containing protein [Tepidisphaeraceae bacterium]|jgi:hypothetical protein